MYRASIFILLSFLGASCKKESETKFDRFPAGKKQPFITIEGIDVPDSDLEIGLFAAEPQLFNPTNMDIDHLGRVWVTEAYNYRNEVNNVPYEKKGDKVLILEDTNGDGKSDKSTVFYQGEDINAALGICVLGNKVIVSASPNVFVLTDENGDGIADSKEVLFKTKGGLQSDHGMHAVLFGPDGKLYFNFGNHGIGLLDKNDQPIKDIHGREIGQTLAPFQDGMAVRCDVDGKNFEVIAWNFRNNYELAVDSYGRIWQSDNDDDGVKSNRINYVMPYGNFGYKDEMTGADWRAYRTNKEFSTQEQHWHQNDPGVLPNLKITGAGSPTGILVYEGDLLPEKYHGNFFLGDAITNDIKAYEITKKEAGYEINGRKLLDASQKDQWFRPSDITIAPDGSLFVADWYDVGVGGHFVGDLEKGRIYRLTPKGHKKYTIPKFDFSTINGSIEALKNPSNSVRYLAFTALKKQGKNAESALLNLANDSNPVFVARALWLLKDINPEVLNTFSNYKNEDIRAAVARMAPQKNNSEIYLKLASDPSYQVKQAVAAQLYLTQNTEAWIKLANAYKSGDRWFLEALGIGATGNWDVYLEKYLAGKNIISSPEAKDIIWRSRAKNTSKYLAEIIENTPFEESMRYFRAFDFQDKQAKNEALLTLLENSKEDERKLLIFKHFDTETIVQNEKFKKLIPGVLKSIKDESDFLDIVLKYQLFEEKDRVLDILDNSQDAKVYGKAAQVANGLFGVVPLKEAITAKPLDVDFAIKRISRMGLVDNEVITKQLILVFTNSKYPFKMREAAVLAMEGYLSDVKLWDLVKVNKVSKELLPAAQKVLRGTFHNDIKVEFEHRFGAPEEVHIAKLPDFTKKGNIEKGKIAFQNMCTVCHQAGGEGATFGPGLGSIGSKLTKEALFTAIVYPNQGINLGYETSLVTLKDGSSFKAIVTSKTSDGYLVKMIGSEELKTFKLADVKSVQLVEKESLMPSFPLAEQDMLDLIEYLSSLK